VLFLPNLAEEVIIIVNAWFLVSVSVYSRLEVNEMMIPRISLPEQMVSSVLIHHTTGII